MSDLVQVTDEAIQHMLDVSVSLVRQGGLLVSAAIGSRDKKVEEKDGGRTDLVTETDGAVEKLLFDGLRSQFPDHGFIGEESTAAKEGVIAEFSNKPTWIIDPIDGTMNFVHSNPMVSVSVGLAINRKVELAIVYLPVFDQLYTAVRGKGAKLNGKPIQVSTCKELSEAMILFELWASSGEKVTQNQSETLVKFLQRVHSIRSIGSAAIDLAFVAGGQADAYFQSGIHCWDMAAGALLVAEAGGVVLDPSGKEFDLMSRNVLVASSKALAEQIVKSQLHLLPFPRDFPDICPL